MRHLIAGVIILALVGSASSSPPVIAQSERCFKESGQCVHGRFQQYWEQNGGLAVFGLPVTAMGDELNRDSGRARPTQWFERNRFELHLDKTPPYNVLLGRLGADRLHQLGLDWQALPRDHGPQPGCLWFEQTRLNVCDQSPGLGFKTYWQTHGLNDSQLDTFGRSLALFGLPLTRPRISTNTSGDTVVMQWFERARFEWHPNNPDQYKVLLGLLGNEVRSTSTAPVDPPAGAVPPTSGCHPSYQTVCIPAPPPDLNCEHIPHRNFPVIGVDPHQFDPDRNGTGCEGRSSQHLSRAPPHAGTFIFCSAAVAVTPLRAGRHC